MAMEATFALNYYVAANIWRPRLYPNGMVVMVFRGTYGIVRIDQLNVYVV